MSNLYIIENHICIIAMDDSFVQNNEIIIKNIQTDHQSQSIKGVVLDLEKVPFLDSSGVGQIMLLQKELEKEKISIVLCHLSQKNQKVFKLTQLDQLLKIYSTTVEAVSSFH